jgi:hypothetical protein
LKIRDSSCRDHFSNSEPVTPATEGIGEDNGLHQVSFIFKVDAQQGW